MILPCNTPHICFNFLVSIMPSGGLSTVMNPIFMPPTWCWDKPDLQLKALTTHTLHKGHHIFQMLYQPSFSFAVNITHLVFITTTSTLNTSNITFLRSSRANPQSRVAQIPANHPLDSENRPKRNLYSQTILTDLPLGETLKDPPAPSLSMGPLTLECTS